VLIQTACNVAFAVHLRRAAPEFAPWWRRPDFKTGADDFLRSLLLTANGVGQQATTSGMVLFVSGVFGVASVPVFTTVRTLANLWNAVSNLFASPLWPEIVRFHATREHEKLFKAFHAHWFFSGLTVNASMIAILPFVDHFYATWTRGALPFERSLFLCTLASVSLANFGFALNVYMLGINNLTAQLVTTAARAGIVFGVAGVLFRWMGLRAIGISLLVAEVACSVFLSVYFTNRELARFDARLPRGSVGMALLGTLPVQFLAIQSTLVGQIHTTSWFLAAAALCFVAWLSWRRLDADVKSRALLLLRR